MAVAACAVADSDLIPARMLNEGVCRPRLLYLEHVAGEGGRPPARGPAAKIIV